MKTDSRNVYANKANARWVIRPLVPEEVYTDREEHLEYLHKAALDAIGRRTMSTVLLGQRRMGKTEIFKRVVNRLFFEQDHLDPKAVVPVYYSFRDQPVDRWDFATKYVENFLRWYAAFRLREPGIISDSAVVCQDLVELVSTRLEMTDGMRGALNVYNGILKKGVTIPEEWALWLPRRVSDRDETSIVMFLDEFQNTRLPQYNFDIVGLMQEAVESPTCPHFVTGSAMSILAREILGRGAMFGRFRSDPIEPMTGYWGALLAIKAARYHGAKIEDEMAPVVADRCGGNPFYITAVIQQAAEQQKPLVSEEVLNDVLAVDLSSGFIWAELNDQVSRWIERMNEYGITKWVLYLSALEKGDRLDLNRIQRELSDREGRDVSIETIRDVLIKLSRGDLLEYMELGGWFRKIDDPILLDFLKVWGRIEVEGRNQALVRSETVKEYQSLKRKFSDHFGYLAEVYMAQVLWNGQRKRLPGRLFHAEGDIVIPWQFFYIWHRVRLGAGADKEVDVYAAAGAEVWIGESKWWRDRKVGRIEVEAFLHKANLVREAEGEGLKVLRLWFFANDGFTEEAEALMGESGVFWSLREDLDGLLRQVGLRQLPGLAEKTEVSG